MEEDQESQYQSPPQKGHHDHNNISNPFDDQGSLDNGDNTKINCNTKQGDDGSRRLCIKFKDTTTIAAPNNNNEHDDSKVCHICDKAFGSGKALGGHMRVHAFTSKKVHKAKQGITNVAKKPNNNNTALDLVDGGNPICHLCKRCFPSMKSLFGHMRCHPERVWRGIQPPPTTTPEDSNSILSSTLLKGWSVTAKRGRKSLSCCNRTDSGPIEHETEQCMQEAVNELMFLASGKHPGFVHECEDKSKIGADQVELSPVSLIKKLKIEEKPLSSEGGSVSDSQVSNGSNVGTGMSKKNKSSNKKKKRTKKMRLTEIGTAAQKNNLDNGTAKRSNKCTICNKSFPSHQALGGHLSSHSKSKSIQTMNESEADDVSTREEEKEITTMQGDETGTVVDYTHGDSSMEVMSEQQCNIICNKTFSIGQVLGGHKTSHWNGMTEAQSAQVIPPVENGQNCPKILSFDLNQLPAMHDEEDGVQSDLFIPADTMASSSYASSSENSVTH